MIDLTAPSMNDITIAIFAGFNWLNHCAVLAAGLNRAIDRGAAPADLDALVQTMARLQRADDSGNL